MNIREQTFIKSLGFREDKDIWVLDLSDQSSGIDKLYIKNRSIGSGFEIHYDDYHTVITVMSRDLLSSIVELVYLKGKRDNIETIHNCLGLDLVINKIINKLKSE